VEDDHVDRPGVEERQRLKLTGTNSSIGLIVLIPYAHLDWRQSFGLRRDDRHIKTSEQPREAPDSSAADVSLCSFAQKLLE
jgi:hypothetical protein